MRFYRIFSLGCAIVFAAVGLIFLLFSDAVLVFFNSLSARTGLPPMLLQGDPFYIILAVAYMYLVSCIAYQMYRLPENHYFPLLLAHGKLASSLLSLGFFLLSRPFLIYLANAVVDGALAGIALYFYAKIRQTRI